MRHLVNFGLLFCFLTLAVTGVMEFALPFSIVTARVHIVFGLATLVLGAWLALFQHDLKGLLAYPPQLQTAIHDLIARTGDL